MFTPETRIYGLAIPDDVIRYVGQTTHTLGYRLARHRNAARAGDLRVVYAWARDVGPENVEIIEIETCAWADRWQREWHWISTLHTTVLDGGLNVALTGRSYRRPALTSIRSAG